MAARFWVGGTGTWDAATTTHWAATSGGAGGASVPVAADTVTFDGSSGTGTVTKSVTGATVTAITINAANITVLLNAAMNTSGTVTFTAGTLNTNGQTCAWNKFDGNSTSTRTLTLGASQITVSIGNDNAWNIGSDTGTVTGLTVNANTSTIIVTGGGASFQGGSYTWNNVTLSGTSAMTMWFKGNGSYNTLSFTAAVINWQFGTSPSCVNLTFNGLGADANFRIVVGSTITVTGTLTLTGEAADKRAYLRGFGGDASALGSYAYTFALGTTGAASGWANINVFDGRVTGTNTPVTGTRVGDMGNNSGITFAAASNKFWVGGTGSWSDATNHWATSSGGAAGLTNYPLPQDTAIFDANSFSANGQTLTMDRVWIPGMDFTNVRPINVTLGAVVTFGNVTWASNITATTTLQNWFTYHPTAQTVTLNGGNMGGTVFQLNRSISPTTTIAGDGSVAAFVTGGTNTLTLGSNTINVTAASGTPISLASTSTFNAGTSTLILTDAGATAKTFAGGGKTFKNVSVTGGGAGAITISGSNTFATLTIGAPKTVLLTAGTTQTITTDFVARGSSGNVITLNSTTAGSAWTITASGTLAARGSSSDWLSLKDSTATGMTGSEKWYAGANSTNVSGNTGWTFTAAAFTRAPTTDASSGTDAATRVTVAGRSAADSSGGADTATRGAVTVRAGSDTASGADVAGRAVVASRQAADAASVAEALSRGASGARATVDGTVTADAVGRVGGSVRSSGDGAAAVDSSNRSVGAGRDATDSAMVVDGLARSATAARASADTATAAETVSRLTASTRGTADAAPIADVTTSGASNARGVADVAPTADAPSRSAAVLRTGADVAGGADVPVPIAHRHRDTVDSALAADLANAASSTARSVVDFALATDVVARDIGQGRATDDVAGGMDAPVRVLSTARTVGEAMSTDESVTARLDARRPSTDVAGGADLPGASSGSQRGVVELASADDAPLRALGYGRSTVETATAGDALDIVVFHEAVPSPPFDAFVLDARALSLTVNATADALVVRYVGRAEVLDPEADAVLE